MRICVKSNQSKPAPTKRATRKEWGSKVFSRGEKILRLAAYEQARRALRRECELTALVLRLRAKFKAATPHQQKRPTARAGLFCCERTAKRCVNAGKNSEKVRLKSALVYCFFSIFFNQASCSFFSFSSNVLILSAYSSAVAESISVKSPVE